MIALPRGCPARAPRDPAHYAPPHTSKYNPNSIGVGYMLIGFTS